MEKNIKKNVCMCITELSCCISEINTTLKVNYTSIKKDFRGKMFSNSDKFKSELL